MTPTLMIVLCVLARLVPHPPNFAPVGATAVFAGRTLRLGPAIALTLGAMFLGDLALSALRHYPLLHIGTLFVYAAFLIQIVLGAALRQRRHGAYLAAGAGSVVFFALSNLGVFLGNLYPHSVAGLAQCYVAALPFFAGTLVGDLAWTAVLVRVYEAIGRRQPALVAAR